MDIKEELSKLINEGEQIRIKNISADEDYIDGEEYENWIAKCIILLQSNVLVFNQTLVKRFIVASESAVGNGVNYYNTMMGILKAFKDTIE